MWVIKLCKLSFVEHKYLVTVDNGVDPMCDREDGRVFEGFFYDALNLLFSNDIDVGSSLIQYHNAVLSKHCPAYAQELLLTRAETITTVVKLEIDASTVSLIVILIH